MNKLVVNLILWGLLHSHISLGQTSSAISADSIAYFRAQLLTKKTRISAHRGNSGAAPENTLATVREALRMQVDYIELDVRTTKDGKLIILHDATLDRTTNGSGPVHERTLAELKKLSAAKGFGSSFQDEQIPTFEDVCQLVADWNAHHPSKTNLYVDCKAVAPEPIIVVLTEYGLLKNAVFYGSDAYLRTLQKVAPTARLMPSLKGSDSLIEKINQLHPYAFDVSVTALTDSLINQIHQQGCQVFVDLLDEADIPEQYLKSAGLGVDVIQTDQVLRVYQSLAKPTRKTVSQDE